MSCGFDSIDRKFGLVERGNLIHIGGRPGSGKTSFMISAMMNLCAKKHTCVFFTLEMSAYEILRNMIAKDFKLDSKDLKKGQITNEVFNAIYDRFVSYIKDGFLIIEDLANATALQIESKVRTLKSIKPIDYVFTDYTQLVKSGNPKHNEVEKINYVTKSFKQSAKYNKVVWVSGSQHSRGVDTTKDRRALLSHLKGSGSIEEDSDIVISLWRPQYYFESLGSNERDNFATLMYEGVEYPCEDLAMIDVLKNRGSRVGEILMQTSMKSSLFSDFVDFGNDQRLATVTRNDFVEPKKVAYKEDEELPF
jgi:replicative DNA helicase